MSDVVICLEHTLLRGTNLLIDIGKLLSGKAGSGVQFLCPQLAVAFGRQSKGRTRRSTNDFLKEMKARGKEFMFADWDRIARSRRNLEDPSFSVK